MAKPIIAIVGRPNVGKSTLFNKLVGQRLSIVKDTPGVTRDRIYSPCEWRGKEVMLVDTGGIEPYSNDVILSQMRRQAQLAIESADVIVLVTDLRTGVTANDQEVASMLLKSGKPVVLCVNKVDTIGDVPPEYYEFYNLGLGGSPFPFPRFMVMAQATCWTPASSTSTSRTGKSMTRNTSRLPSSASPMWARARW